MKKLLLIALALLISAYGFSQDNQKKTKKEKTLNEKGEIIKKGWNFGPLPVVGYDADLGFQYGVTCDIFNYGNGSRYPRYDYKMNVEASRNTGGSSVLRFYADFPYLIKNTKLFVDVSYFNAKKYEFFGYNGYESNPDWIADEAIDGSHYNNISRSQFRFISSIQRPLFGVKDLYYSAGLAYYNTKTKSYDSGETLIPVTTLYDRYNEAGLIKDNEADGGNTMQVRAGLVYDSRDHNSVPSKGIYAEGTLAASPDIIDKDGYSNLCLTMLWRQYLPVYKDKLTFAYRLGSQNLLAGETPWYMINNLNTMFFNKMYTEGLGGSNTVRGVDRNRIIGEGFAFGNVEMRWNFLSFQFINQNWMLGVNPFFDAGIVTQRFRGKEFDEYKANHGDEDNTLVTDSEEGLHTGAGCGLKVIMNRNLVVSVDLAKALDKRDGEKMKTYISFNYIF